jgi:hypothetical protein
MASHRAQADALEIQAQAKRRLADEYDAAQERGKLRGSGKPNFSNTGKVETLFDEGKPEAVSVADIGLTHKQIHEARQIRDAEEADPGIVRRIQMLGALVFAPHFTLFGFGRGAYDSIGIHYSP